MLRDGKAFKYTAEEVTEEVQSWQTHLTHGCDNDVLLTPEQERLLGLLIEFLQIVEEDAAIVAPDFYDFHIRTLWNNEEGCTVRIDENMSDRLLFMNLNQVEEMIAEANETEAAFGTLMSVRDSNMEVVA
jgi:hypothetical protein